MRYLILIAALCIAFNTSANPTRTKLIEVNKCWLQQPDVADINYPNYTEQPDEEWIKLHLQLVEQTLRNRNTDRLTREQKHNRELALDHLNKYWQEGRFPQNEVYDYRVPIFIDKYDNFCAVGYLVKATGHEEVSRMIAADNNLAYVHDMRYPELTAWAKEYGFTIDELGWIQPGYTGTNRCLPVGKGAGGNVYELYADTSTDRLYVGGQFEEVDSSITANNIAYVTEQSGVYTWHGMGGGTNGRVRAVCNYNDDVFVGGTFSTAGNVAVDNIAYWDGTLWSAAGCINGLVKDLVNYRGNLYAVGDFDMCDGTSDVNFAKWNGTSWEAIEGLSGKVNTTTIVDTNLILAGMFSYQGNQVNAIAWNMVDGFKSYNISIPNNEVNDLEYFNDTLYAACSNNAGISDTLLYMMYDNEWHARYKSYFYSNENVCFNAISAAMGPFLAAGDFKHSPNFGSQLLNSVNINMTGCSYYERDYFALDSTINVMEVFKGELIVGGLFKGFSPSVPLYGIAKRTTFYNLEVQGSSTGTCGGNEGSVSANPWGGVEPYTYTWSTGDTSRTVSNLLAGPYTVEVTDWRGKKSSKIVTVPNNNKIDATVDFIPTLNKLLAKAAQGTYQWVDCNKGYAPIDSQVGQQFVPGISGNYAVVITSEHGCIDTSACYEVTLPTTGTNDVEQLQFQIYPNPADDLLHLRFKQASQEVSVAVTDMTGRVLITQRKYSGSEAVVDVKALPPGIYLVTLVNDEGGRICKQFYKQ